MRQTLTLVAVVAIVGCSSEDPSPAVQTGTAGSSSTGAGGSNAQAGTAGTGTAGTGGTSTVSAGGSSATGGAAGNATTGSGGSGTDSGTTSDDASSVDASSPTDASRPIDAGRESAAVVLDAGPSKERHTKRPIGMPYAKNGFWEYLPPGYGDGTKRPLLAFFHGVGENGNGSAAALDIVLAQGPPKLINANQWPADRPFVVLSMQHAGGSCPTPAEIHDFFTFAMTSYEVDPARIYITGLSCGAHGAWSYLGQYKGEQVVAGALIAGDSNRGYNTGGCSILSTVAIWDFHGTADSAEPFSVDSAGMTKFLACPMPHKEVKFTPIQGADHEPSWTVTYNLTGGNDIYSWLLAQTR